MSVTIQLYFGEPKRVKAGQFDKVKNHKNHIVVAVLFMACLFGPSSTPIAACQTAEDSQQNQNSELPLPNHAIWRFGEIDSTQANGYYLLKFSPDGKYLATRNRKNIVEIRNANDRQLICELAAHKNRIKTIDFSPDSKFLLTVASVNDGIQIWNVNNGQLEFEINEKVMTATFSKSGKSIFVLAPNSVIEYSWPDGKLLDRADDSKLLRNGINLALAIDRSGQYVVTQSKTNNQQFNLTKLIDTRNQTSIILPGPSQTPKKAIFSNDNNWIAAMYPRREEIRLWNVHDPQTKKYDLKGHNRTVESIAFSNDSRFLVTTGWDKKVVVWDVLTRASIAVLTGHRERANCADFSTVDFQLASGASGLNDSTVIMWSLQSLLLPGQPEKLEDHSKFNKVWQGLGSTSPSIALRNLNRLKRSAPESIGWIEKEIGLIDSASLDIIRQTVAQLQADTFAEREAATMRLIEMRASAERILLETLETAESTEVRYRLNRILNYDIKRPKIKMSELRQLHRVIYLLELLASDLRFRESTIRLLKNLSLNHPHIDVARDASASIERINAQAQ